LLQQQLAAVVEDEQGEGPMQSAATLMAVSLAHMPDGAVHCIDQDEGLGADGTSTVFAFTARDPETHKACSLKSSVGRFGIRLDLDIVALRDI
jgi:hypothetical protein